MKILRVSDLKQALDILFQHITDECGAEEIELSKEFYWNVPLDKTYTIEVPAEQLAQSLDIGSLIEDFNTVRTVIEQPELRVPLQLAQIAPLLRFLAEAAEEKRIQKR